MREKNLTMKLLKICARNVELSGRPTPLILSSKIEKQRDLMTLESLFYNQSSQI